MLLLWLKTLHIIAVISWFAGLFYLPRLFVYHVESCDDDERGHLRFCVMEHKLFHIIMIPAAVVVLSSGLGLLYGRFFVYWAMMWFRVKMFLVCCLYIYMVFCWRYMLALKNKTNTKTGKYFRFFNEVPTILLILIITMVVMKPHF